MKEEVFKYLVLKIEDLIKHLPTCYLINLDKILDEYNNGREKEGKDINKYFVINRDEVPEFQDDPKLFIAFMHSHSDLFEEFVKDYNNV